MSNSQIKKANAISHNKMFDEKKALELDKKINPEKYARPKPTRKEQVKMAQVAAILSVFGGLN